MEDESPLFPNESEQSSDNSSRAVEHDTVYKEIPPEFSDTRVTTRPDDEYDSVYYRYTNNSQGITWYKATFLIVNAALGAGLLNFPEAFDETGGIGAGNLAHVIFVSFAFGSLVMLAVCATEEDCKTYQEVVRHFCGGRWSTVCSLCITLYCFVTCVTFIIIIGDQFDRVFESFYGSDFCHHWYLNRKFTMVASSALLIFPCCFKRIDCMELMSYVGVASVLYLTVVIAVEMAGGGYPKGQVVVWDVRFVEFFNVVPTICFGYQCHVSSVPILSCLKSKERPVVVKACACSIVVCFLVYTVSANCGYLTFGSLVSADVLLDYQARKWHVLVAVLLLAIKSWMTYPILLFCVREAVADLYLGLRNLSPAEAALSEPRRRKVIAVLLWIGTIIFAVFIQGLNTVIRLLGSLAGVFILVFPGMCYLNRILSQPQIYFLGIGPRRGAKIASACAFIVLGAFTFGLAFSLGVEGFLRPQAATNAVCV